MVVINCAEFGSGGTLMVVINCAEFVVGGQNVPSPTDSAYRH